MKVNGQFHIPTALFKESDLSVPTAVAGVNGAEKRGISTTYLTSKPYFSAVKSIA
jgi:hypothetical protein